uniref:Uncharacterized protein n=1 Tax=Plectus sambesii TaxID=2011161 RepID=A0A914WL43_9BILA
MSRDEEQAPPLFQATTFSSAQHGRRLISWRAPPKAHATNFLRARVDDATRSFVRLSTAPANSPSQAAPSTALHRPESRPTRRPTRRGATALSAARYYRPTHWCDKTRAPLRLCPPAAAARRLRYTPHAPTDRP